MLRTVKIACIARAEVINRKNVLHWYTIASCAAKSVCVCLVWQCGCSLVAVMFVFAHEDVDQMNACLECLVGGG